MIQKQIFEKIAKGEKLNPLEMQEFTQFGERLQTAEMLLHSWTQDGVNRADLLLPRITRPDWVGSPLKSAFFQRTADTTIPTTTNTYITFDTSNNFGDAFRLDDADASKVIWTNLDNKAFNISGYVTWAGNATGYRAAYIEGFDGNDVSIGTSPLHTFAGQALVDNVLPISFSYYFNGFAYIKFFVHQTSGGDLTMKDFLIGLSLV